MKTLLLLALSVLVTTACNYLRRAADMAVEVLPVNSTIPPWRLNLSPNSEARLELSAESLTPLAETDSPPVPVTLSLDFKADGPNVIATVLTQDHKLLGKHTVHPYEFVELNEIANLGYRPFTLMIVEAAPPAEHTVLVSNAPSLRIEATTASQFECAMTVTNLSSSDVVGYAFGSNSSDSYSFQGTPVLRARETKRRYCPAPGAVLTAAIFRDGSHEGDDRSAARLLGSQIAAVTQYRLVAPTIDRTVADPALNDDQRIALIKEAIFHLATKSDLTTIRAMRSRLPDLPAETLTGDLDFGLLMAREQIWHWFYPYAKTPVATHRKSALPHRSGNCGSELRNSSETIGNQRALIDPCPTPAQCQPRALPRSPPQNPRAK